MPDSLAPHPELVGRMRLLADVGVILAAIVFGLLAIMLAAEPWQAVTLLADLAHLARCAVVGAVPWLHAC